MSMYIDAKTVVRTVNGNDTVAVQLLLGVIEYEMVQTVSHKWST